MASKLTGENYIRLPHGTFLLRPTTEYNVRLWLLCAYGGKNWMRKWGQRGKLSCHVRLPPIHGAHNEDKIRLIGFSDDWCCVCVPIAVGTKHAVQHLERFFRLDIIRKHRFEWVSTIEKKNSFSFRWKKRLDTIFALILNPCHSALFQCRPNHFPFCFSLLHCPFSLLHFSGSPPQSLFSPSPLLLCPFNYQSDRRACRMTIGKLAAYVDFEKNAS